MSQTTSPSSKRKWIIGAIAAGVLLLPTAGFIVACTNQGEGTPRPSTTAGASSVTAAPDAVPNESTTVDDALTKEGWVQVPVTNDPVVMGTAAARAVWSFDSYETTRQGTIDHLLTFLQPTPEYQGDGASTPDLRQRGAQRTLENRLVLDATSFVGLQGSRTKVTSTVVGEPKVDDEISTWRNMSRDEGFNTTVFNYHKITTTLDVQFSSDDSADGVGDHTDRVIVTVNVQCDPDGGICGVRNWALEPEL